MECRGFNSFVDLALNYVAQKVVALRAQSDKSYTKLYVWAYKAQTGNEWTVMPAAGNAPP